MEENKFTTRDVIKILATLSGEDIEALLHYIKVEALESVINDQEIMNNYLNCFREEALRLQKFTLAFLHFILQARKAYSVDEWIKDVADSYASLPAEEQVKLERELRKAGEINEQSKEAVAAN